MHKVAPQVQSRVNIPLIHIADATAQVIRKQGMKTVGLLGTAFTMEHEFYKGRLETGFGLKVLTPGKFDRKIVHDVIYRELCLGKIKENSKTQYLRIIDELAARGAQAVILGCTEIGLLVGQDDTRVPLLDTTLIHAAKAVSLAIDH